MGADGIRNGAGPMSPEANIENAFVRYIEDVHQCECLKLRVDGQDGFPDRTVITPAGCFFVEFKKPAGKLRPQQRRWNRRLQELNHAIVIVRSFEEAVDAFNTWFTGLTQ